MRCSSGCSGSMSPRDLADLAGDFGRRFGRSHGLDVVDALVAAAAEALSADVATLNVRHFPMFPGLAGRTEAAASSRPRRLGSPPRIGRGYHRRRWWSQDGRSRTCHKALETAIELDSGADITGGAGNAAIDRRRRSGPAPPSRGVISAPRGPSRGGRRAPRGFGQRAVGGRASGGGGGGRRVAGGRGNARVGQRTGRPRWDRPALQVQASPGTGDRYFLWTMIDPPPRAVSVRLS